MILALLTIIATGVTTAPVTVPDGGSTAGLLVGTAVVGLGLVARFVKRRKK